MPFGEARFQTIADLRSKRRLGSKGVVAGVAGGKTIAFDDDRHWMVMGPTRSGKGRGFVIPNILGWHGSAICVDFKREVYNITANHRRKGGQVFLFSPGSKDTHRYNPLDFVRDGSAERITDIQKIAQFLLPSAGNGDNSMWRLEARRLLAACFSYIIESERYRSRRRIGEAIALLSTRTPTAEVFETILDVEKDLSRYTRDGFASFIAKAEKEQSGVRSEAAAALRAWENPLFDAATAASDFDLRSLRRKRMTIYLAPNLVEIELVRPLLTLFIQQTFDVMTTQLPGPSEPEKVLVMLDEFTSLNRVTEIISRLPIVAGYNMKFAFICHGLSHLDELYEQPGRNSILSNTAYQLVLGANDLDTADYVSKSLGVTTIRYRTKSRSMAGIASIATTTRVEHLREQPLLQPREVRQMDADRLVLMVEGDNPITAKKLKYDKCRPYSAQATPLGYVERPLPPLVVPPTQEAPATTPGYIGKAGGVQGAARIAASAPLPEPAAAPGIETPPSKANKPADLASDGLMSEDEARDCVTAALGEILTSADQEEIQRGKANWQDIQQIIADVRASSAALVSSE